MTADLHTSTGAHALDAVPPAELRAFEAHLSGCEPCTREVRELRETATRLGMAVATDPPPTLKMEVLARIRAVRQDGGTAARRRTSRLFAAAASVLLVVVVALSLVLVQRQDMDGEPVTALPSVLRASDARIVTADTSAGHVTLVVSRRQDRLVLLADELPPAPPGKTYQVWKITPHHHSAGLLAGRGRSVLEIRNIAGVEQVLITMEPDGGSRQPTSAPIVRAVLP